MAVLLAAVCLALAALVGVADADTVVTADTGTRWVTGTTYDLATEDTLPGIDVALWRASDDGSITADAAEATATTDPDGDYALPIASEGTYVVRFTDPLGLRQQLGGLGIAISQPTAASHVRMSLTDGDSDASSTESDPGSGDADPSDDTTITGQDAYLGLPWTLAPTVVDGITGEPLPGITVRVAPSGTTDFAPDATTDASGTFSLGGLPVDGMYRAYLVDPSGQRPSQYACDELSPATDFEYPALSGSATSAPEIVMHRPGSLDGHVTFWQDDSAVPGAPIELLRADPASGGWTHVDFAVADDSGYYAFSNLAPGHYRVTASNPPGELPSASQGDDGSDDGSSADDNSGDAPPVDDSSVDTAPADDSSVDAPPADDSSVDTAPADDSSVDATPAAGVLTGMADDVFVGDESTTTADIQLGESVDDGGNPNDPNDPGYYIDGPGASGSGSAIGKSSMPTPWWFLPLRPKAPSSVRFRRAFSLSGRFHARTRNRGWIRVECSRFEHGRWIVRKTLSAKTHRQANYVDYYAKFKLPKTGKWRIRVRWTTATSGHVWSKFRYVTVSR